MNDNVAEKTDTVAQIGNVAGKRGRGRPRTLDKPINHFGLNGYANVTLHLEPDVVKALRIMAIKEDVSMGKLCSEALATWLKWLAKAAREEAKEEDKAEAEEEFKQICEVVRAIRTKKWVKQMVAAKKKRMVKALKSKRNWKRV